MQAGPPNDLPLSLYVWAAGLLQVVVGGLAVAIWRDVRAHGRELLALRIVLTGKQGTNGVRGDVAALRKWRHDEAIPAQTRVLLRLQRLEDHAHLRPLEEGL